MRHASFLDRETEAPCALAHFRGRWKKALRGAVMRLVALGQPVVIDLGHTGESLSPNIEDPKELIYTYDSYGHTCETIYGVWNIWWTGSMIGDVCSIDMVTGGSPWSSDKLLAACQEHAYAYTYVYMYMIYIYICVCVCEYICI